MRSDSEASVAESVAEKLRAEIQSGALRPGERLVERKLAARLAVSHIPVREALTELAQEKLIVREPHRGARVAQLTEKDLEEISSLRIVLEQFMVVRAQERWNEASAHRLNEIVDAMAEAAPGDTVQVFRQDRLFHEALAELAEHSFLDELSGQLRGRVAGFLVAANAALDPAEQEEHVRSHRLIVDAIASGDPELAKQTIALHIATATARLSPSTASSDRSVTRSGDDHARTGDPEL